MRNLTVSDSKYVGLDVRMRIPATLIDNISELFNLHTNSGYQYFAGDVDRKLHGQHLLVAPMNIEHHARNGQSQGFNATSGFRAADSTRVKLMKWLRKYLVLV